MQLNNIDTKTVIINLLYEDQKTYLSINRLQRLISYIYEELIKRKILKNYNVYFDINFEAIRRSVIYDNYLFDLDIDGEIICLKDNHNILDLSKEFVVDKDIKEIITAFHKKWVA